MALPVYPTDPMWNWASDVEHSITTMESESAGNYLRSRRLSTRDRQSWTLSYKTTTAKWAVIYAFWKVYAGQAVSFTTPDGVTITAVVPGTIKRTKNAGFEVYQIVMKEQ
jgi:hypothetical protein